MKDASFFDFIKQLQAQFAKPLPGEATQFEMAPIGRAVKDQALKQAKKIKESAVLALLYPKNNLVHTVLMLRNQYPGVHSSQISFPGGKKEPDDKSFEDTALRETEEEIGVSKNQISIIGNLTDVFIPPSGYFVKPFVGYLNNEPNFVPEAKEVQQLLHPSINELANPKNKTQSQFKSGITGLTITAPCYQIQNHLVWGATAMMIAELNHIIIQTSIFKSNSFYVS